MYLDMLSLISSTITLLSLSHSIWGALKFLWNRCWALRGFDVSITISAFDELCVQQCISRLLFALGEDFLLYNVD